jgi:hypothetical protein
MPEFSVKDLVVAIKVDGNCDASSCETQGYTAYVGDCGSTVVAACAPPSFACNHTPQNPTHIRKTTDAKMLSELKQRLQALVDEL